MTTKIQWNAALDQLSRRKPQNREELAGWLSAVLDLQMPRKPVCSHHQTPLDFLAHGFFEAAPEPDAVVWACRGGGKTTIGAIATLLDLLFKPGIQIRILGGSLEQSEKMYEYLLRMIDERFRDFLKSQPTQRRLRLTNGSQVQILAQSDRSVRGQRVQKLRCDEVELFDPAVWQAAQLTTKSVDARGGRPAIRGALESFSTMHKPGGLMQRILNDPGASNRKSFAWCIWDVIEECPASRQCNGCPLWSECHGRAKSTNGFVKIDDVIAMKSRVSQATWEHEMLCHPPRFEDAVFPAFRRERHVGEPGGNLVTGAIVDRNGCDYFVEAIVAGVDFGYVGAFVCLWMAMLREVASLKRRAVWVLDELVTREHTVSRNAALMRERPMNPEVVYCDVAGHHANSQTGKSDERVLREAGFMTRASFMQIEPGISVLTDLLDPADGSPRLFMHPRCERLIAAFETYQKLPNGKPDKDNVHDHLIDALRYAVVGHDRQNAKVEIRHY